MAQDSCQFFSTTAAARTQQATTRDCSMDRGTATYVPLRTHQCQLPKILNLSSPISQFHAYKCTSHLKRDNIFCSFLASYWGACARAVERYTNTHTVLLSGPVFFYLTNSFSQPDSDLTFSVDDTKLGEAINSLRGREALKRSGQIRILDNHQLYEIKQKQMLDSARGKVAFRCFCLHNLLNYT